MMEHETAQGAGDRPGIVRTPRTKVKPAPSANRRNADETRNGQMTSAGKLLAGCPMTADELADQWNIAADDVETISVKVLRQVIGTREQELMDSVPLVDYDGQAVARNFGPGTYYLRPSGRQYAKNAAKLPISDALARSCGFGRIPVTAADVVAERTLRQAVAAPTDPADLLAAIQQVVRREIAESRNPAGIPQVSQSADPFAAMKQQFENMQSMMAFMGGLEERAIKTVEMRMGRADVSISPEDTNTSLLEKLLPKALDIFGEMMKNRNPAPPVAPTAPGQHQAQHQAAISTAVSQPATPIKEGPTLPTLTQDEQKAIGGAVAMLRPFAGHLVGLTAGPAVDADIVAELEGFIPAAMVPSLEALAAVVADHGPNVLAAIHPDLATERWASILPQLVAACAGE